MCLDAIQKRNAAILDPQLDVLLSNLHPLVIVYWIDVEVKVLALLLLLFAGMYSYRFY